MDPISILLLALKAGAKLAAESTIGDAASDAYNAFKERIKKRFSGKKAAEVALEEYEKDPDVWEQPLIKALKELNADKDRVILRLAEDILEKAGDTSQIDITGPTAIGHRAKAANTFIEYHFHGNRYQGPPPRDATQAIEIYRCQILRSCQHLPLRGMDIGISDPESEQKRLGLKQIYVDLNTRTKVPLKKMKKGEPFRTEEKESKPLPALKAAIQNRRMVLLGDPGSGKSTFLTYLAYGLAASGLSESPREYSLLPDWPADEREILPIQILLRDFARQIPRNANQAEPQHLWQFIKKRLKANNLSRVDKPLQAALENGRAMVLLDGMDEVPSKELRKFVCDAVNTFAERYKKCRFLVTCRILSYEGPSWQLPDFPVFELAPFDEGQIDHFIGAWYDELVRLQVVKDFDEGKASAARLMQAVRKPDMWRLAPNPLLLTVMALVHTHRGRLPEARALLYEETIDILLWRWEKHKAGGEEQAPKLRQLLMSAGRSEVDLKRVLWELAFEAHGKGGTAEDPDALADINELRLEKALSGLNNDDRTWAQHIIEAMKLRAGLLIERIPEVFTFPHRTFQEYLAGAHLSSQANFAKAATTLVQKDTLWREVILLAVGRLVFLSGDTDKPLALVGEMCPIESQDEDIAWRKAWMAGDILLEMELNRAKDSKLGRELLERVRYRLADLVSEGKLLPVERAAAGRTLAKLKDPRPGVGVHPENGLPDILWCHVPVGEFRMGSDKKKDTEAFKDEFPQRHLFLPDFYISRYPVTNAQFRAFMSAGGYQDPRYWPEAKGAKVWKNGQVKGLWDDIPRSRPEDFGEPYNLSNHPVVGITWYEALAFCYWLKEKLQGPQEEFRIRVWQKEGFAEKTLHTKQWRVLLPSEAEWEKSARGYDERIYPWGDRSDPYCANYRDTKIGSTSAAGCFPAGGSPFGLLDMSGNVWEWTRSHFRDYPYTEDDREDLTAGRNVARVLRGGAFFGASRVVRCASRDGSSPYVRRRGFGIRVVLSPA